MELLQMDWGYEVEFERGIFRRREKRGGDFADLPRGSPAWRFWTRRTRAWTWTRCAQCPWAWYQKDREGGLLIIYSTQFWNPTWINLHHGGQRIVKTGRAALSGERD